MKLSAQIAALEQLAWRLSKKSRRVQVRGILESIAASADLCHGLQLVAEVQAQPKPQLSREA
jgi:hypothetical protein